MARHERRSGGRGVALLICALGLVACDAQGAGAQDTRPLAVRLEPEGAEAAAAAEILRQARPELGEPADAGAYAVVLQLAARTDCAECFRLERPEAGPDGLVLRVVGGAPLGLQYGVYAALEALGYRFYTPFLTRVPERVAPAAAEAALNAVAGQDATPLLARRGLHLHTLHPVEGLYDFWLAEGPERAVAVLDWIVQNRGNYVQWVALDDILDPGRYGAWRETTRQVIAAAHRRGMQVGINPLVFAASSLQNAYVVDTPESLTRLLDLDFDVINLSFGEFLGEDPAVFVETVQSLEREIHEMRPAVEVTATIHVGNYERLRVHYQGAEMLYYFLVQFVSGVTPWVHTVMYFNLVEPTVGAYLHEDFSEHRAFLNDRLAQGAPVAYFPESAYWIAFDNSVPVYLPIYLRSRWLDLVRMAQAAGQDPFSGVQETVPAGHVIFSSGWEWGYWQNDALTLRHAFAPARTWWAPLEPLFAETGEGPEAARAVRALATVQRDFLIGQRLAPYFAGVDFYVEMGHHAGIIGQPDRVLVAEAAALGPGGRDAFRAEVLTPLGQLAEALEAVAHEARGALASRRDPVLRELWDGLEICRLRAAFVHAVYRAVVDADAAAVDAARALWEQALAVVTRRHAALAYPEPERLLTRGENPTIYPFGYLRQADTLCLWSREILQAEEALGLASPEIPWCID